jgi:hypothetical protein
MAAKRRTYAELYQISVDNFDNLYAKAPWDARFGLCRFYLDLYFNNKITYNEYERLKLHVQLLPVNAGGLYVWRKGAIEPRREYLQNKLKQYKK